MSYFTITLPSISFFLHSLSKNIQSLSLINSKFPMSKLQSEKTFRNSQNTLLDLGLGFLSLDSGVGDGSRLPRDLCALLHSVLRSPPGSTPSPSSPPPTPRRRRAGAAEVASVLLGASMALVMCGSVTFVIGMMMMPWVIGLVIFCYFMGIVSGLRSLGKAILCSGFSSASTTSPKETSGNSSPKYHLLT